LPRLQKRPARVRPFSPKSVLGFCKTPRFACPPNQREFLEDLRWFGSFGFGWKTVKQVSLSEIVGQTRGEAEPLFAAYLALRLVLALAAPI
jgi:hypothetical protein